MRAEQAAEFGAQLRRARLAADLKATALAKALGVTRTTVHNWESGTTLPSRERLAQLAVELGGSSEMLAALAAYPLGDAGWAEGAGEGSPEAASPSERTALPPRPPEPEAVAGVREAARRSPEYWIGRQETLHELMGAVGRMQAEVTEMHAKATAVYQEIIANTVPTPLTPEQRAEQRERDLAVLEADRKRAHAQGRRADDPQAGPGEDGGRRRARGGPG